MVLTLAHNVLLAKGTNLIGGKLHPSEEIVCLGSRRIGDTYLR